MKPILEVNNVSMSFRIEKEKTTSFKEFFIKKVRMKLEYEEYTALQNINFSVKKGEVFGIIGFNGAGKSTLLKIVSGILKPSSGTVAVRGTVAPLIELGAGFNHELSGIENIYLNGLLLGYPKSFLKEKEKEIISFSELGTFIHSPIKNYSSGMKARLGFAIATCVKPDLLIVDEALSVGDIKFKQKCENRIREMMDMGTTVLFVSHSLGQVEGLCSHVLWLENGKVKKIGESEEIIAMYKQDAMA